jgi:hypothetical protein
MGNTFKVKANCGKFAFNLKVKPCVPLTQLVELDFQELLGSILTKVVSGYITHKLHITSFVKNNKFLAIITSFLTKITSSLTKLVNISAKIMIKLVI